jgi:hypothetical protein
MASVIVIGGADDLVRGVSRVEPEFLRNITNISKGTTGEHCTGKIDPVTRSCSIKLLKLSSSWGRYVYPA